MSALDDLPGDVVCSYCDSSEFEEREICLANTTHCQAECKSCGGIVLDISRVKH